MKKRAKIQQRPRTGPPKEKVQITVRIDKQLIDAVYAQMKDDNRRITDMIEEGLNAVLERSPYLPKWTLQIRFMVANATKDQEKLLRGLLIAMAEGEVLRQLGRKEVNEFEQRIYETCKWFLETRNHLMHAPECVDLYSRYGKPVEEPAPARRA